MLLNVRLHHLVICLSLNLGDSIRSIRISSVAASGTLKLICPRSPGIDRLYMLEV